MIVAMRTKLIALLIRCHVLPKRLLAALAKESHLRSFGQRMLGHLSVALCTIEPSLAARCPDGDLRVQDVFAGRGRRRMQASGFVHVLTTLQHLAELDGQ